MSKACPKVERHSTEATRVRCIQSSAVPMKVMMMLVCLRRLHTDKRGGYVLWKELRPAAPVLLAVMIDGWLMQWCRLKLCTSTSTQNLLYSTQQTKKDKRILLLIGLSFLHARRCVLQSRAGNSSPTEIYPEIQDMCERVVGGDAP